MNDYKDMLLSAMAQGKSLDEVMRGIDAARAEIKQEADIKSKYAVYNDKAWKSFGDSVNTNAIVTAIACAEKIRIEDAAKILTHFICQNVPGYTEALAKIDMDPIEAYTNLLKSQIDAAKVITDTQDTSDEEKGMAIFNHLIDEVLSSLSKKHPSEMSILPPSFRPPVRHNLSANVPSTDEQKVADFFKRVGL